MFVRLFVLVLYVFFGLKSSIHAQQMIRIAGTELVPFHYLEDGKPAGIFVEIIDQIFAKTGQKFSIEIVSGDIVKYLANGKADAAMSISYHPSRASQFYFTDAFKQNTGDFIWSSQYYFFVRDADKGKFTGHTYAELKSKNPRVGIITGASYETSFWDSGFTLVRGNDTDELFQKLHDGQLDLLFVDKTQGKTTIKKLGLTGIGMLPDAFITKTYTLAFANKPALIPIADAFFKEYEMFKVSGASKKIFFQYLKDAM